MQNKEVNLILPWPPSVNQIWSSTRKGNWYTTKVAKEFKQSVYYYIHAKKARHLFKENDLIEMTLRAYPPDNRKRDLDNLAKVTLDALQESELFPNDCQIKKLLLEMLEKDDIGGRLIVSLKKID